MNINELKARAYDCIANVEFWTLELKKANNAIAEYKPTESEIIKVEEVIEESN